MKTPINGRIDLSGIQVLKNRSARLSLIVLIVLILAVPSLASISPAYRIPQQVIAPASGWLHSPANRLQGTLGQAPVGLASSGTYQLCSGFRCSGSVYHWLYLPLTKR